MKQVLLATLGERDSLAALVSWTRPCRYAFGTTLLVKFNPKTRCQRQDPNTKKKVYFCLRETALATKHIDILRGGGHTRREDVEVSPAQSRISLSIQRMLRFKWKIKYKRVPKMYCVWQTQIYSDRTRK